MQVTGHLGPEQLDQALEGCDVVVIPAGVPRKPGMIPPLSSTNLPRYVFILMAKRITNVRTHFCFNCSLTVGMTRDDLFNTNASIVQNLTEACAR